MRSSLGSNGLRGHPRVDLTLGYQAIKTMTSALQRYQSNSPVLFYVHAFSFYSRKTKIMSNKKRPLVRGGWRL